MKLAEGMSERFAARVRRLRDDFVSTFPGRAVTLERMCQATPLDSQQLRELRTEVHQLKGSAGMYQLDAVFSAARDAEKIVDEMLEAVLAGQSPDNELQGVLAPLFEALSNADH